MNTAGLRIAVVGACPYPVPQGSQVYLRDSAVALSKHGHDVHLVVYGHGLGEDSSGLRVHRSPRIPGATRTAAGPSFAKPLLDALLVRTLRRVVREFEIDVIAAHNYEALLVALAARNCPVVYHAHNCMADELPYHASNSTWSATFGRWLDRTFPRRAAAVVAPHEPLRDYLVECGCDADRMSVVSPIIDAAVLEGESPKRRDCPVLYTGNLDDYQNLDLLYDVMRGVVAEEPGTQLVLATADARPVDYEFVRRVSTPDWPSLQRELARDAIFACPRVSWSGYPVKILNAMAAGLPIVCSESAAHPLMHQFDALVVPDGDSQAFQASILRLMRDPDLRRTIGEHARKTYVERLAPERVLPDYVAAYRTVL